MIKSGSILEQLRAKDLELNELKAIIREKDLLIEKQTLELQKLTQFYSDLDDENILLKSKLENSNFEKQKFKQINEEFNDILLNLIKYSFEDDKTKHYESRINEINKKVDEIKNEKDIINNKISFLNNKNKSLNDLIILKNEQIKDLICMFLKFDSNDEENLENLKLISQIKEGDTISNSSKCLLKHKQWGTSFFRTFNQENRISTFKWIKNTFYKSIYDFIINKNVEYKDIINLSISKISELVNTYKDDEQICSKYNKLTYKINLLLQINEYL